MAWVGVSHTVGRDARDGPERVRNRMPKDFRITEKEKRRVILNNTISISR